jgi:hypothetical protein
VGVVVKCLCCFDHGLFAGYVPGCSFRDQRKKSISSKLSRQPSASFQGEDDSAAYIDSLYVKRLLWIITEVFFYVHVS